MKTNIRCVVFCLYLMPASFCGAADFKSIPMDCSALKMSAARNQRIEVGSPRFSVLPPQGQNWCVKSMDSQGVIFFKGPGSVEVSEESPSKDEVLQIVFKAVQFVGVALALSEFGVNAQSPDELKVLVDAMISKHLFSQIIGGISSAERRFQLLESHTAIDRSLGVSCVRFDAKVEERGMPQAPPGVVLILNFADNLVCAHPQSASSKSIFIWISFVEIYRDGDQSVADTVRPEVEPFLRSLQFVIPG